MDLRTERTRKNIVNAFIELRAEKTIEKITVKELADRAYINKATFYRHYEDIYNLSESIESEIIQNCVDMLEEPIQLFEKESIQMMVEALSSQGRLFDIIFSGSRKDMAIHKVHDCLLEKIFAQHPEYRNDLEKKVMLSALIYGMFQSYRIYKDVDLDILINSLVKFNSALH